MITFDKIGYMGRLGNQMFQFASTIGIAKKLDLEAKFPLENCLPENQNHTKCDLIECFDIEQSYFIPRRHIPISRTYTESDFKYDPGTRSISDDTSLSGYFQTEKYFISHRDLICSQFKFRNEYSSAAELFIDSQRKTSDNKRIVAMHVRRGDYVMYPDHHPVCSKDYYYRSIAEIEKAKGDSHFVIFSDDVQWCKNEFPDDKFTVCDLNNPYSEMCAMTLCDDHIIANSSFSWWGAWLNIKSDKMVIAPISWFGKMIPKDTSDVYCNGWIKK